MTESQKQTLLSLARNAIRSRFDNSKVELPSDAEFQAKRGLFVTLNLDGDLRGCIGMIEPRRSIAEEVVAMARAAAFRDPRFPPLSWQEFGQIQLEISILSELMLVKDITEIVIGRDGLLLTRGFHSGVFLPQVPVEWNWDLSTYLTQLCYKACLPDESWKKDNAELFRFEAEVFGETQILP